MSTAPLNLSPIIARLSERVAGVNQIGGAARYASATLDTKAIPAIFVVPLSDVASGRMWTGSTQQAVKATFGVLIGARNLMDDKGGAAQGSLLKMRESVTEALLGWVPPGCSMDITYNSGRLLDITNSIVWWQDDFETGFDIGV
jgi:hypothetical protein